LRHLSQDSSSESILFEADGFAQCYCYALIVGHAKLILLDRIAKFTYLAVQMHNVWKC